MKYRLIVMSVVTSILFSGCGSSSSSNNKSSKTEQISKRDYVVISYHYPKDVCKSSELKNLLESYNAKDIVTSIEYDHVTCTTYGKSNNGVQCVTQDTGYNSEPTCVAGLNRNNNSYYKLENSDDFLFVGNIRNTVISAF